VKPLHVRWVSVACACLALGCSTDTFTGDDGSALDGAPEADPDGAQSGDGDPGDAGSEEVSDSSSDVAKTPEAGPCDGGCGSETCCSNVCVNTKGSDKSNCGGCGTKCYGSCSSGVCTTCTVDVGSCSHTPCAAGAALSQGCDPENIVQLVCTQNDASCCSSSWTSACASYAALYETSSCGGC
jgi:hypothetical protein